MCGPRGALKYCYSTRGALKYCYSTRELLAGIRNYYTVNMYLLYNAYGRIRKFVVICRSSYSVIFKDVNSTVIFVREPLIGKVASYIGKTGRKAGVGV